MSAVPLKLIVGLGNPGDEYAHTRHNAGFWFVDELARRAGVSPGRSAFKREPRHQAELARVRVGASEVWLMKPLSYMNLSGGPVASVVHFYKIAPDEVLVAYDELDFPPGIARLKQGGGHAGHNGIRDVIGHIGETVWRLRIGIGRPETKGEGISRVLGRAPAEEERLIHGTIAAAADVIPVLMEQGDQQAMNLLHSRDAPQAPAP
jgi:PTH1 family peptidyl-tRNA hydrolase